MIYLYRQWESTWALKLLSRDYKGDGWKWFLTSNKHFSCNLGISGVFAEFISNPMIFVRNCPHMTQLIIWNYWLCYVISAVASLLLLYAACLWIFTCWVWDWINNVQTLRSDCTRNCKAHFKNPFSVTDL